MLYKIVSIFFEVVILCRKNDTSLAVCPSQSFNLHIIDQISVFIFLYNNNCIQISRVREISCSSLIEDINVKDIQFSLPCLFQQILECRINFIAHLLCQYQYR